MSQSISVFVRSVYGKQTIYPACSKAKAFALLTGKKTLDARDLKLVDELGFAVVYVADPAALAVAAGR
jgi:hypothetical protein